MFLKIEIETLKLFTPQELISPPPRTQLRASFTKLNDSNNNYNLSNLETDLDLSKAKN